MSDFRSGIALGIPVGMILAVIIFAVSYVLGFLVVGSVS